jgi:hypothetical protein
MKEIDDNHLFNQVQRTSDLKSTSLRGFPICSR